MTFHDMSIVLETLVPVVSQTAFFFALPLASQSWPVYKKRKKKKSDQSGVHFNLRVWLKSEST